MPSVFTVLRAITALFRTDARPQSRPLRRLRLRSRLPVRSGRLPAGAQARASATSCSICPTRSWSSTTIRPRPGHDRYDYSGDGFSTEGLPRDSAAEPFRPSDRIPPRGDHEPGEYAALVDKAKESFRRGDLFEVVPGQMFYERCETQPSEISPAAEGDQPVALFLLHQSRRGRISDRRVAGDVRAGQWPPRRDLPDLRHDQARRRRDLRLASRS